MPKIDSINKLAIFFSSHFHIIPFKSGLFEAVRLHKSSGPGETISPTLIQTQY